MLILLLELKHALLLLLSPPIYTSQEWSPATISSSALGFQNTQLVIARVHPHCYIRPPGPSLLNAVALVFCLLVQYSLTENNFLHCYKHSFPKVINL